MIVFLPGFQYTLGPLSPNLKTFTLCRVVRLFIRQVYLALFKAYVFKFHMVAKWLVKPSMHMMAFQAHSPSQ